MAGQDRLMKQNRKGEGMNKAVVRVGLMFFMASVLFACGVSAQPSPEKGSGTRSDGAKRGKGAPSIADPLEPVNRAVFVFNDRLYVWVLKPVATGYKTVLPRMARTSIGNFFANLTTPVRLVNALLQGKVRDSGIIGGRFLVNTTWGIAGFRDPASRKLNMSPRKEDFGQTLAVYHVPHGIYITWPLLGPSSLRNTLGKVGDYFLDPVSYLDSGTRTAAGSVERINALSLRLGEYEELRQSALDLYISLRNGFIQRRSSLVNQ